jgi:hypothetical protein
MPERADLELDTLTIRIPMRLQRRGGRKLIMTPEEQAVPTPKPRRDDTLIKALVRAHRWRRRIESGQAKSITDLAEQESVTDAYICLGASRRGHETCPVRSRAAGEVEGLVLGHVKRLLASPEKVARTITAVRQEGSAADDSPARRG